MLYNISYVISMFISLRIQKNTAVVLETIVCFL